MDKLEYWDERINEVEIQKNKLVWEFAQAEINLKNDFSTKYNDLEVKKGELVYKRDNGDELVSKESVEENKENNDGDKSAEVSDLPDRGDNRDGKTATAD